MQLLLRKLVQVFCSLEVIFKINRAFAYPGHFNPGKSGSIFAHCSAESCVPNLVKDRLIPSIFGKSFTKKCKDTAETSMLSSFPNRKESGKIQAGNSAKCFEEI